MIEQDCILKCCQSCTFCNLSRAVAEERPGLEMNEINRVKGVCCVNHSLFVPSVASAYNVVGKPAVGVRLQKFWQVW